MIIQLDLNHSLRNGHPVDRFIITVEGEEKTSTIVEKINPYNVSYMSCTCDDSTLKWSSFLDHRGQNSIVYEIPRKYSDAFNNYIKLLKIVYY